MKKEEISETVVIDEHTDIREVTQPQPMIKYLTMDILNFSGRYEEQSSFYDIFVALIHTTLSLTAIQKFFYLQPVLFTTRKTA